jgi:hypothetical protein
MFPNAENFTPACTLHEISLFNAFIGEDSFDHEKDFHRVHRVRAAGGF